MTSRRDWPLMLAVVLASSLVVLDATLITIAMPELAEQLDVTVGAVGWVVAAYALAICCTLPLTGWAARRFGERRVWLVALCVFTGALIGASMSWDYTSLLGFRIAQGVGSALIVPVGQMLLAHQVGPDRMPHALAITGFAVGIAPVFGPSIAGAMMTVSGWRAVFLIGVPIGVASVIVSWFCVPRRGRRTHEALDVLGALLGAAAMGATIFGLSSGVRPGAAWLVTAAACTLAGLVLGWAFVARLRRQSQPLLDLSLPARRPFARALGSYVSLGFAFHAGMVVLPWELIAVRGMSAGEAGMLMTAQVAGATAVMLPVRRLMARVGTARTTALGLAAGAASTAPLALWSGTLPLAAVAIIIALRGFSFGAVFVSAQGGAYEAVRLDEVTSAAPQINITSRLGGALGVAVCTMVVGRAAPSPGDVTASAVALAWWVVAAVAALGVLPALLAARDGTRLLLVETAGDVDRLARDEAGPW